MIWYLRVYFLDIGHITPELTSLIDIDLAKNNLFNTEATFELLSKIQNETPDPQSGAGTLVFQLEVRGGENNCCSRRFSKD